MAGLNISPPNLPFAPQQYDSQYQEQFNKVLRLFFARLNNPGDIGGATLNLDLRTLPTDADLADLRLGDVFRDTTTGATANSQVLRIKTA
jgi:hypothetical protein